VPAGVQVSWLEESNGCIRLVEISTGGKQARSLSSIGHHDTSDKANTAQTRPFL
jgi:hypothetical protein